MKKFQLLSLMYIAFGGAFYGYDFGMSLLPHTPKHKVIYSWTD